MAATKHGEEIAIQIEEMAPQNAKPAKLRRA
jgi:hypothetical protein